MSLMCMEIDDFAAAIFQMGGDSCFYYNSIRFGFSCKYVSIFCNKFTIVFVNMGFERIIGWDMSEIRPESHFSACGPHSASINRRLLLAQYS